MNVQLKHSKTLKEKWGNKPCSHPNLSKEYYLSSATGDYICTQCGESFNREEKNALYERKTD